MTEPTPADRKKASKAVAKLKPGLPCPHVAMIWSEDAFLAGLAAGWAEERERCACQLETMADELDKAPEDGLDAFVQEITMAVAALRDGATAIRKRTV